MMLVVVSSLALSFLSSYVHGSALPSLVFKTEPAEFQVAQQFLATKIEYDDGPTGTCTDTQVSQVSQEFVAASRIMLDAASIINDQTYNYGSMLNNFVPPQIRQSPDEVRDIGRGYYGYTQYLDSQPSEPVIKLTCNEKSAACTDPLNGQQVAAYWDPINLNMNLCTGYWSTTRYNGDLPCTKDGDLRIYDSRGEPIDHRRAQHD